MQTELYSRVAARVLKDSLRLKKGETLTVETWNNGLPFAREVVKEARRIGCIPITLLEDEAAFLDGVKNASKEIVGSMGKHEYAMLSGSDNYVFIPGPLLGTYTRKITRQEYIDSTKYNDSWYEAAKKANLRGVRMTFGYIGQDIAKLLGRSVADVFEHQLRASLVSFEKIAGRAKEIAKLMEEGANATLTSDGMKLTFELKGKPEIQDGITDGEDLEAGNNVCYIPPGYVETEVTPSSVSGAVKLSPSLTRFGKLEDATLEFEEGKLVSWTSRASPDVVGKLAEVLPGKSPKLAGLVVGLNPMMRFGFGQDRFPAGSVSLLLGFTGILRRANLEVGGETVVKDGGLS